jgi:hypothetical protein
VIKSVIFKCRVCRRYNAKPIEQMEGWLPKERITRAPPFRVVGLDFCGPMYVRQDDETVKIYILIVTCAVIRAVHLEVVPSLSQESFLLAFRRFIARRGSPTVVYSDNFSTFKKCAADIRVLQKIVRSGNTKDTMANWGIEWRFTPERAAWYGGIYERLIGSIKSALKKTIGKSRLTLDQFQTVLVEIEFTINQRPLTAVSDEPEDLSVLTPNQFLISDGMSWNWSSLNSREAGKLDVVKTWKALRHYVESCWTRWHNEYLAQLRSFHQSKPKAIATIRVGDLVLVVDTQKPRFEWKMGRVLAVDKEELPRVCRLKIAGAKNPLTRSIRHLVMMEESRSF